MEKQKVQRLNKKAMFKDRKDAAEKLALELQQYYYENPLIIGIPNGGIETAYHLARRINGEMSFIVCQELYYPATPETCFGAVSEDGSEYISHAAKKHLNDEEIGEVAEHAKHDLQRLIRTFRAESPFPEIYGRTVIITDDGHAPSPVLHAVAEVCAKHLAKKIVIALPAAHERVAQSLHDKADEVIVLESLDFFTAPGECYERFPMVTNEMVRTILHQSHEELPLK
jgi:putative phosphoribosyl transferase